MTLSAKHALTALCALIVLATMPTAQVQAQDSVVNFNQAEIQAVIDDVSAVTGYTFIVDPNVRGRVTITSQAPLTADQYFQVFLSTMRVHGYTVVPTASGAYQIVPGQAGARSANPVNADLRGDQFATAVVRLNHIASRDALAVVRPLVGTEGSVNATETGNVLVMVDYAENISRLRQVIRDLDRDTSVVEMVELTNVSAADMTRILQQMRTRSGVGEDETLFNVAIAPIPASNTVLLRGNRQAIDRMMALVRRVDSVSQSNQSFRVIYLSHANGEDLLPILQQVVDTMASTDGVTRSPSVSHHAPTNSVVINAEPDVQRQLELVIRQLDIRRPQVLVEGIIVEMSDTTAHELGVQMLLAGGDGDAPIAMTRFSSNNPDLLALTGAVTSPGDDDSDLNTTLRQAAINSLLGATGGTLGFGGQNGSGNLFGLVLNAVERDVNSNVLATPSILALDNEEAYFLSGQEIPVTTGEALGSNNTNPFRTVDREEVGVKLSVVPQITEGNTVRLHIVQEVSSVAGTVNAASTDLITNKREISTTVLADNGEIIVLGGLIRQEDEETNSGVPGLSRVPGVGRLFRSEGTTSRRTNLMVFIRPTIIRSEADMRALTENRYDFIRSEQMAGSESGTSSLESIVEMMMVEMDQASAASAETAGD
ncbi:type II secretion system protein GspD [Maricaulis sp. W15]|uniref:type II secretion system secretin GspD n=1 Tax=Maricaulis sp. W15 TaxID=1772333 RepID=UPI000948A12C|nr:type II secretion system secretin GspD [Maricaulis sp. W15]OLF71068.1 type II secretion system protein GspD [Maricaulis sp. W15]